MPLDFANWKRLYIYIVLIGVSIVANCVLVDEYLAARELSQNIWNSRGGKTKLAKGMEGKNECCGREEKMS